MTTATVVTQAELDAALSDAGCTLILIKSPKGTWLSLSASDSATVQASDSATVRAFDSATVQAFDSATVEAFDSVTVQAFGSVTVEASDSATVEAFGSVTVWAFDSATVRAFDSATVRAFDSVTVQASKYVAVHLHSARATVAGGVVIDISALDLTDPATWTAYHGVNVDAGEAILYKAVGPDLKTGQNYGAPTVWAVGETTTAPDWIDSSDCGSGLHASPRPAQAKKYRPDSETGTRYLRVVVPLADLRPIGGDKAKAPSMRVLAEVDVQGVDLPA